jgi:5'-nucleotidase / UDP-sugar diphosphatase
MLSDMKTNLSQPILVISTISDLHGQLEPTYAWGTDGTLQERGGIARLAAHLHNLKEQYPNKVLFFGSGDYLVEDFNRGKYLTTFGGQAIAPFLNDLAFDAGTIGNHEFDFGFAAADQLLSACTFPLIATNLKASDFSRQPLKKLILHKNGYKIGVLGVMPSGPLFMRVYGFMQGTKDQKLFPLQFEPDLYGCMQHAVDELKIVDQVDFVIVLSHIGIEEDQQLAERVHGIDLICGGHTHLATKRGCEGVVQKSDHGKTIISHPGDKGRTLGIIKLWPKENGQLAFACDLLEVDASISHDQEMYEKLRSYQERLPRYKVVATTTCPIDTTKQAMRKQENSFANFVADVVRDYFKADMVLINASGIRGEDILPPGDLTDNDLDNLFSLPNDQFIKMQATGSQIRQALELGAADIEGNSRNLLHVSGLRYTIDASKQAMTLEQNEAGFVIGSKQQGNRIVLVEVAQKNNHYIPLDDNREYEIMINSMMIDEAFYLAQFYMFKSIQEKQNTGLNFKDVLLKYLNDNPIISPNAVGRLIIKR